MTTSTDTASTTPRSAILPAQWLLSGPRDLTWLLGSVLVSFGLYALWQSQVIHSGHLVLIWVFVFHGPHFWSTLSRTYLDRSEWPQRRRLFLGSLLWFVVGPVLVGAGLMIESATGSTDGVRLFFFLAALWAYHHVVKQHFGFMALYRARHRQFDRREFLFHRYYLLVSLWMPAIIVLSNSAGWLLEIPFVASLAQDTTNAQRILDTGAFLAVACEIVFWVLQGAFALHLAWRAVTGRGVNVPEVLLVICAVGLHWVAVRSALTPVEGDPLSHYAFVPLVTIYHNIQYHALIWHYNKTKYQGEGALERYGWAHRLNRNFAVYALCGIAFTLVTIGVESYGIGFIDNRAVPLGQIIAAFIWGYAFMHYYVDSKIWHVRQDAELRKVLGFE